MVSLAFPAHAAKLPLDTLKLPPGFSIAVFAAGLDRPRELAVGARGTVFAGSRGDTVYALVDANGDGVAETTFVVAKGLVSPNGVAFRNGALYVAEIGRILRFDGIEERLADPPRPVVVTDAYPKDGWHGWKFIRFGPDGLLYVPVGANCNVCRVRDPFASITRLKPEGGPYEVFARGIRNTVGFDWHPDTKELWFTENGRDMLGDDVPPEELNRAPRPGLHFGFPYCHAGTLADPEFGAGHPCSQYEPPAGTLGAHRAPLGMRFYSGMMFPPEYRGRIVLAEHGSWNRSAPVGYQLTTVRLEGARVAAIEPFVTGWLQGKRAWGRPVDVQPLPDGSLLVSDDRAGVVYRVTYTAKPAR